MAAELLVRFRTYSRKYRESPKREFKKQFTLNKTHFLGIDLEFYSQDFEHTLLVETNENSSNNRDLALGYMAYLNTGIWNLDQARLNEAKDLYDDYIFSGGLTESQVHEIEQLASVSVDSLGLIATLIFTFEEEKSIKIIELISDIKEKTESAIARRMTLTNLREEESIQIRESTMKRLHFGEICHHDFISKGLTSDVKREEILTDIRSLYGLLLKILKELKETFDRIPNSKYLINILKHVLVAFQIVSKESLSTMKKYSSGPQYLITIRSIGNYSSEKREKMKKFKEEEERSRRQELRELRESKRTQERIKQETQEAEKSEQKRRAEEARKEKELEKQKKKSRKKEIKYPEATASQIQATEEKRRSRSRSSSESRGKQAVDSSTLPASS
ncbi:putative Secreted Protein (SKSR family), partial [Cryptosporidium felis]